MPSRSSKTTIYAVCVPPIVHRSHVKHNRSVFYSIWFINWNDCVVVFCLGASIYSALNSNINIDNIICTNTIKLNWIVFAFYKGFMPCGLTCDLRFAFSSCRCWASCYKLSSSLKGSNINFLIEAIFFANGSRQQPWIKKVDCCRTTTKLQVHKSPDQLDSEDSVYPI